jgi:hypothetical protein
MHDEVGNDLSFPALHLGTRKLFLQKRSNQTMKPPAPLRHKFQDQAENEEMMPNQSLKPTDGPT